MATTELLTNQSHSREDLRMVESAIRKGWVIPEQLLESLPKIAGLMALKGKPRDQIAAMKVLLAMKEQNSDEESPKPQPQTTINVGVNVENVPNTGRGIASAVLARLGNRGVFEVVPSGNEGTDSE